MIGLINKRYSLIHPTKSQASGESLLLFPTKIGFEVGKEIVLFYLVGYHFRDNPDYIIITGFNPVTVYSYYFPQYAFYSISFRRRAAFFGYAQAETADRRSQFDRTFCPVENKPLASRTFAPGIHGLDVTLILQAADSRKPIVHRYFLRATLTVNRFLPLARRRERTARPFLVLFRFRKPWSFSFFRLDG